VNSYYQDGPVDDAFYYENGASNTITFRDTNGNILYSIRRECANPVGSVQAIEDDVNYTLVPRTTVPATVFPGGSVTFRHYIRNNGPDSTSAWWAARDGFTGNPYAVAFSFFPAGNEINVSNQTVSVPANAPFGTRYCQYADANPIQPGAGYGRGPDACTTVVADFDTVPTVVPDKSNAQQNDSVTFTYRITVSGNTRSSTTNCKAAGQTQGPGYTPLPQQDVDRNPAVNPQPSWNATYCGQEIPRGGPFTVGSETINVGNATPGTRVCRSFVINPRDENGGFRSSAEACVVIAKTPYVHFMGNDVWAGGGFPEITPACNTSAKITTSSRTLQDGSIAGSISEYGGFALGKITNFGTASKAIVNPAAAVGKMLTFSNTNAANLGFYAAPQHCINNYISTYSGTPVTPEPATIDVGGRPNGTWQVNGARTFHGNMPAGSQQIYLVNGDVTIDNDIKYPGTYSELGDIPSLVIIATGNIFVQDNVQQMDGLFVARSAFNTCSNAPPGNLSVNTCNNQLTINGAVIAGTLTLLRTHGADGNNDTDRKKPSEVFNFNAEMYLRSALKGGGTNTVRVVDEKDLPPRY
jgi:hypothetical protein